jgi:hypothetical protein
MAGSGLFVKAGFVSVESIPPYELLVKKFKKAAPDPHFIVERERVLKKYKKGPHDSGCRSVPYGVFSIVYDGKLIAERPISARRFTNIMSKLA